MLHFCGPWASLLFHVSLNLLLRGGARCSGVTRFRSLLRPVLCRPTRRATSLLFPFQRPLVTDRTQVFHYVTVTREACRCVGESMHRSQTEGRGKSTEVITRRTIIGCQPANLTKRSSLHRCRLSFGIMYAHRHRSFATGNPERASATVSNRSGPKRVSIRRCLQIKHFRYLIPFAAGCGSLQAKSRRWRRQEGGRSLWRVVSGAQ